MINPIIFVFVLFSIKLQAQCTPAVSITIYSPTTGTTTPCPGTNYFVYANPNGIGPYQWTLNGIVSSTTDYVSSYNGTTLVQGDIITCAPISDVSCPAIYTVNYARPHYLTMSVSPSNSIQTGTSVTLTGNLNIGGTALLYTYAFYVNGAKVNTSFTNAPTFNYTTNSLVNGDVVYATVQRNPTSNPCGSLDTSNNVTMAVGAILPVSLTQFTANSSGNQFLLNWSTASEINAAYFNIQESGDGINFTTVGQVVASGNSSTPKQYNFSAPPSTVVNIPIYFRLQMVDKDGTFSYSFIQKAILNNSFKVVVSPNPATGFIYVSGAGIRQIQFLNMSGQILYEKNSLLNSDAIDVTRFARGIYFLKVEDLNGIGLQKVILQ